MKTKLTPAEKFINLANDPIVDHLASFVRRAETYLVFAFHCRWDGSSGYRLAHHIVDAFRRDYDAVINPLAVTPEEKVVLCVERTHDVPMGAYTLVVALSDEEHEELKNASFDEVEQFAEEQKEYALQFAE